MRRPQQLHFRGSVRAWKPALSHGGGINHGKRKQARPFSPRLAVHVVMRAEGAQKNWSMLARKHKGLVYLEMDRTARESKLRLFSLANVGNHLHVVVKARAKRDLQRFLRVLAGRLAMRVTGARKGRPLNERFWTRLAFTRLVEWGRAFTTLQRYVAKNLAQAHGPHTRLISDHIDLRAVGPPH